MLSFRQSGDGKMNDDGESVTLITCSGISNTGRLTSQAALILIRRDPFTFERHIPASKPPKTLEQAAGDAERILVLDGCEDCCARRKLAAIGIEPDVHVVATAHGIEKNGMADVQYHEIEMIVRIVRDVVRE
jgi:uncharacterized metal-binding protein